MILELSLSWSIVTRYLDHSNYMKAAIYTLFRELLVDFFTFQEFPLCLTTWRTSAHMSVVSWDRPPHKTHPLLPWQSLIRSKVASLLAYKSPVGNQYFRIMYLSLRHLPVSMLLDLMLKNKTQKDKQAKKKQRLLTWFSTYAFTRSSIPTWVNSYGRWGSS